MDDTYAIPHCINHPDREGRAHYKDGTSLCDECLSARLDAKEEVDYDDDFYKMIGHQPTT